MNHVRVEAAENSSSATDDRQKDLGCTLNLPMGLGIYIYVEDLDAHFERAMANGAKVVYPPEDTEWGTRRYRALDLDGYEWSIGTYWPCGEV